MTQIENMQICPQYIPDKLFKEILDKMPICTVDIALFNQKKNKILLCKRSNKPLKGVFLTNGGRLLKNEQLEDCAVRQASLELGISIDKSKLIFGGVTNEITDSSIFDNVNYHNVDIFFGYILDELTPIQLDKQHSEFKWFSIQEKEFHPFVRKIIDVLVPKL